MRLPAWKQELAYWILYFIVFVNRVQRFAKANKKMTVLLAVFFPLLIVTVFRIVM
jgi:hypothetical protein